MAAYLRTQSGDVVLVLSPAEARALATLAEDGAEGILTDPSAAAGYIGGPASMAAARRALRALQSAAAAGRDRRSRAIARR